MNRRAIGVIISCLSFCLQAFGQSGVITTVAGNGTAKFSGDSGPAMSASLNNPYGVAVDTSGNVYIADYDNNRVRKVSPSGVITTVAGNGNSVFSGDGGPATSAGLCQPSGVAVDASGNLFIADNCNNLIRKVSPSGIITTVAGNGNIGTVGSSNGDGGPALAATLANPAAVAVDASGNLFIADLNDQRIRKVSAGGTITTIAGNQTTGFSGDGGLATSASLYAPSGVAVDASGNLFIADSGNNRIRKVSASGVISTVAGNGTSNYSGDGGTATSASLYGPYGVAVDATGNLFVADNGNNRIRKVSSSGIITTVAGSGANPGGFFGDGGPAISADLNNPSSVAVDASGNFFIADYQNNRIRRVSSGLPLQATIRSEAGDTSPSFGGDGGSAVKASLHFPTGVAMDAAGNLYVADSQNNRVRMITPGGTISTVAGTGNPGSVGDGGPAASASLDTPYAVAVDPAGNLYISELNGHRVRMVNPSGIIVTFAGTGSAGFSGDGGPASSALLNKPIGIAVDSTGNVYIADSFNYRIRKVDTNGNITTVAGNGQTGFSGDGGAATSAQINIPTGITIDGGGNLFIAIPSSGRVRKVSASGTITTVAGNGSFSFCGDGGQATAACLNQPYSTARIRRATFSSPITITT